jgi:hypothetical protein
MPEGPAERGVEATRAWARASARHAESMDGAEPSGSIERVMAGRHGAAILNRRLAWRGGLPNRHDVQIDTDDPSHLAETLSRNVGIKWGGAGPQPQRIECVAQRDCGSTSRGRHHTAQQTMIQRLAR